MTSRLRTHRRPPRRRRRMDEVEQIWPGYFHNPDEKFDPDKQYDPSHSCLFWRECCTKNINLMPTPLRTMEGQAGNIYNKKKKKFIETEMLKVKAALLKSIQNKYETKHNVKKIMAVIKTYTWYCNELLRVKKFHQSQNNWPPAAAAVAQGAPAPSGHQVTPSIFI